MSNIANDVRLTGVPPQAMLQGAPGQKQTQGAIVHVTYQSAGFPVTLHPDLLSRLYPQDTLLDALQAPPFTGMTNSQKLYYIREHHNPEAEDGYICDPAFGPAHVVFESLGTGRDNVFLKLSAEDQNTLLRGCDLYQAYMMINRHKINPKFPKKRHNMVFRPSNWTLTCKPELPRSSYTLLDLDDLTWASQGSEKKFFPTEYEVLGKPLGIVYTPGPDMRDAALPPGCEWYGHGIMKSCLQKILRYAPLTVQTFKTSMRVDDFLESVSRYLCVHGDGFIPDLQIHVKGYEGYFKRLAVSIVEDAYTPDVMNLVALLAAGLAARSGWIPTETFFVKTLTWAQAAIEDRRYYDYNWHEAGLENLRFDTLDTPWQGVVEMMEHLKSFKSDLLMFRSVAVRRGGFKMGLLDRPPVMLESRSVDHHSVTEIAHILWDNLSFNDRFLSIWHKSSGINWRKKVVENHPTCVFAQQAYSYHAQAGDETFEVPLVEVDFRWQVEISWISYMIGVFHQGAIISFCDPEDPYTMRSIRRPSRDKKPPLSLEAIELHNATFEKYLKAGVAAKNPFTQTPEKIVLTAEGFSISGKSIEEWCQQATKVNMGPHVPSPEWYTCLTSPRPKCSMVANWQAILMEKVRALSEAGHQRLVQMFQPIQDVYEVPRIARDGGSSDLTVKLEDTEVVRLWMVLHYLLPGVFTLETNFKLKVSWRLGFLAVRDTIMATRVPGARYRLEMPWTYPAHLNEQQSEALEELERRRAAGLRGNLIWMSTGAGKTALALKWLHNAMTQGKFPGYAIFTYPKSSESNLKSELRRAGMSHVFVGPKNLVLPQGQVICIHHDDLRRCEVELLTIADRALVVIDEVHLFMNETQRTSMGLLLATLSVDFVGMTGTLIYDKDVQKVVRWLKQIVRFPVTPSNFYIAISSICSHLTEVPVAVEDLEQRYEFPDVMKETYLKLVPASMGGSASQIDFRAAAEMCYQYVEQLLYQEVMASKRQVPEDDVFLIVRDTATAQRLQEAFLAAGLQSFAFTKGATLTYTPESPEKYDVIIAPYRQTTGYTLTKTNRTFTSIYFTNTAARQQIKARNIRIGQTKTVYHKVIHCGILSYVKAHYDTANSLVKSLSDLAKLHAV